MNSIHCVARYVKDELYNPFFHVFYTRLLYHSVVTRYKTMTNTNTTTFAIINSPGFKQYKFLISVDMTGGEMANGRRLASTSIAETTCARQS